jgi:hypothetical protein
MAIFMLELEKDQVVEIHNNAQVVPILTSFRKGYIQNLSNREVLISDTVNFDAYLIIGSKTEQSAISTINFDKNINIYLKTLSRKAKVSISIKL